MVKEEGLTAKGYRGMVFSKSSNVPVLTIKITAKHAIFACLAVSKGFSGNRDGQGAQIN
jgi:hypothetical protein